MRSGWAGPPAKTVDDDAIGLESNAIGEYTADRLPL
jgi:hypothetical protein